MTHLIWMLEQLLRHHHHRPPVRLLNPGGPAARVGHRVWELFA